MMILALPSVKHWPFCNRLFLVLSSPVNFCLCFSEVSCLRQWAHKLITIGHENWTLFQRKTLTFVKQRYWKFRWTCTLVSPKLWQIFSRWVVPWIIPEFPHSKSIITSVPCYANHVLLEIQFLRSLSNNFYIKQHLSCTINIINRKNLTNPIKSKRYNCNKS